MPGVCFPTPLCGVCTHWLLLASPLLCVTPPLPQLLNVDGTSISGLDSDGVAAKLRGQEGSSVWIKVARRHSDIPGVAGLPPGEAPVEYKQFRVRRAQVELNPVFATTMSLDDHTYGAGAVASGLFKVARVSCAVYQW